MVEILYEDNHIIATVKPHGIVTQQSTEHETSLEEMVRAYLKKTYNKPGNIFLHAIHRLDKVTKGIVLFAKTSKALSRLNDQMRKNGFQKEYRARVEGTLQEKQGSLIHTLQHKSHKAVVAKEGKNASLHYVVTDSGKTNSSELVITLETGRYHQIRCQFAYIGHPIVGDTLYGAKTRYKENAIALCHTKLSFVHPVTKEPVVLTLENTF